ncbi:MAG: hypothetical protein ACREQM_06655 [Candidatus Dormibacteraceae bacterium]
MPNRIFCEACGAPLAGVGAICSACGAGAHPQVHAWALPDPGAARPFAGAPTEHSTVKAAMLGVIPGLGHLYAGHSLKAVALFGAFVAALFVGADLDVTVVGAAVGVPLDAGGLGLWLFSIWDAYWTVRQDNRVAHAAWSTPSRR